MANRRFVQFRYSLEKQVVDLFIKVSFGASGAPTLVSGKGIASITRASAGKYNILLSDTYQKLLAAKRIHVGSSASAAPDMYVVSDSSNTLAAPTVVVQFDSTGTATDPASGEASLIQLSFSNTTAF